MTPPTASANDAQFQPVLQKPPTLVLNQGARQVLRQQEASKRDELWQGDAFDPLDSTADDVPLYFRLAPHQATVAELMCSVMAQALGLPTPQPYLLYIPDDTLTGSRFATPGTSLYCVATHDIGGPTFAQLLNQNSAFAQRLIRAWAHLLPVTAFDEWLANGDRNYHNLLFVAQSLWLIDHAEALGGSARKLFPLSTLTQDQFTNKLAILLERDPASQRQHYLGLAQEWLTERASQLDVRRVSEHAGVARWHSDVEVTELVDFITQRLTVTHALLCQRLGHPQLIQR